MALAVPRLTLTRTGGRVTMRPVASTATEEALASMTEMLAQAAEYVAQMEEMVGGGAGEVGYAALPDGLVAMVKYSTVSGWPARRTGLTSVPHLWYDPSGLGGQPPGAIPDLDIVLGLEDGP